MEYIKKETQKRAIVGLQTVFTIALTTVLCIFIALSNYTIKKQHEEMTKRINVMKQDLQKIRRTQDEILNDLGVSSSIYIETNN